MACADCLHRGLLLRELAARIDRIVDRGVSRRARDLLALDDAELSAAAGLAPQAEPFAEAGRTEEEVLAGLAAELDAAGCWSLCRHDSDWPPQLELLGRSAPSALFGRGDRSRLALLDDEPAATVVGSRRAGPYGTEVAAALAEQLARAGIPVISGMAFGVDTAAHFGALRGGGLSVALLGAGAERPYPRSRARLYRELVRSGLVLSELPPATPTFRWMFPARNRIMAALAGITIVVEAAERSGSLITAEMAADCGRVVGAVPGPVNSWRSAGANMLLADGGAVVRDAQDVLDLLLGPGGNSAPAGGRLLDACERAVLDEIEAGAGNGDAVAARTGIAPVEVAAALSRLERDGYLQADLLGTWRRTALVPRGVGEATPTPE